MAHWYKDQARFTEKSNGWPRNKDGSLCKRPTTRQMIEAGAVLGVTSILQNFGNSFWMPKYFGDMGIAAGLASKTPEEALRRFKKARYEPSDKGTDLHEVISEYLIHNKLHSDDRTQALVNDVENLLAENGIKDFRVENTFTEIVPEAHGTVYAFGGTIDLESPEVILDWKTCTEGRRPYWKEVAQLAAYDRLKGRDLMNVYINRDTWRIQSVKKWTKDQAMHGWELFRLNYDANEILRMTI